MRQCNACHITVDSPIRNCPLCATKLKVVSAEPEPETYPDYSKSNEVLGLTMRILIFISISIAAICVTINLLTPIKYPWSLIIVACMGYIWIALGTAIYRRHRLAHTLMIQLISLALLMMALGSIIGFKWSVYNIIFPSLAASAMLCFNIVAIVQRKEVQSFLIYYLVVAALGFIPLILLLVGIVTIAWPAICCAVYSFLSIVSIFVFAYKSTRQELHKRFRM